MFSKKSLIYWLMALVALAIIAFVIFNKKEETDTNFGNIINKVNRTAIDKIVYKTAANNYDIVAKRINSEDWIVTANGIQETADTVKINTMFLLSSNIRPIRIVGNDESKWKVFEVDEQNGTHVQFYDGKKVVGDFYVGKNEWVDNDPSTMDDTKTSRPGQSFPASYLRVNGDVVTYMVDGNLNFAYPDDFNRLRSQTIYAVNYKDIDELIVNTAAGKEIKVTRTDNERWIRDGIMIDSVRARTYVGKLRTMICNNFVHEMPKTKPDATLTLKGKNMETITVNFWPYNETDYVINSSYNKEGIFLDKNGVLRKRIEKF